MIRLRTITPTALAAALLLLPTWLLSGCDQPHAQNASASAPQAVATTPTPTINTVAQGAQKRIDAEQQPLSAVALLGQKIFFDKSLSGSGKMSCATCHDPASAFAPNNALSVQLGGPSMQQQGGRAVPSLTYLEHTPPFMIGPDQKPDDDDNPALKAAQQAKEQAKLNSGTKVAGVVKADLAQGKVVAAKVEEVVPQGGMDWDGRAKTLPDQAGGPLLDPKEMANKDGMSLMAKLKAAPYAGDMVQLFGSGVFTTPNLALGEAYFALARFQAEDQRFHRYNSKFDYYLAGRAQLSQQELHGKQLFDDPKKGNCASCHLDKPSKDGRFAPVFTDYQFEALAAPRNMDIQANHNPHYYDEGLCGPARKDMAKQENYCGLFKTPTLRNVGTRHVFFHNGVFHSLDDVVRFYVERETKPEKWYPTDAHGKADKYNDLPVAHRGNVDVTDAPFDRKQGDAPALNEQEIQDVVAFLNTLTDGYQPNAKGASKP